MLTWVSKSGLWLQNSCSTLSGSLLTPPPTFSPALARGSACDWASSRECRECRWRDTTVQRNKKFITSLRGEGNVSGQGIGCPLAVSVGRGSPVGGHRTDQERSLPSLHPPTQMPHQFPRLVQGRGGHFPGPSHALGPAEGRGPLGLPSYPVSLAADVDHPSQMFAL